MSARTVTEYRALAKTTKGLAHLASCRNTGTWVSRCGRQIRGNEILEWQGEEAGVQAVALGDAFCEECRAEAIRTAGTVADGVAILLSLDPADDSAAQLLDVPVEAIGYDGELRAPGDELTASVAANGVLTPIVARRSPNGLRLVSGGRRLTAALAAGHETIPTIVRALNEEHLQISRILDNSLREDLDPIAKAQAYQDAMAQLDLSQAKFAQRLGIARPTVSNSLRLLDLPKHIQEHVAIGNLTAEQGRSLLSLNGDADAQDIEADRMILDRNARRVSTPVHQADPEIALLGREIARLLEVKKVQIKTLTEGKQLVINVANDADLDRILALLSVSA